MRRQCDAAALILWTATALMLGAQSSLTTAIQRMERKIGGVLFLRSTRAPRVQLTTLGLGRHLREKKYEL
jgi:DNA-binding transcriptional LysR family regulator